MSTLQQSRAKLGAAIAAEIKRQRLTQREAAELTGVSQSRISRIIAGDLDKTSTGRFLQMAEALGAVVRITLRRRRDDERARIAVTNKLKEETPPFSGVQPPEDIGDLAALASLLAGTKRKLSKVEGELRFERQRIDELGGPAFDDLMDNAILLGRARSSGDPDAEATARERVEAAVEALLDQRKDMHDAYLD
jgi:predicted XRE-type DNA-binding protein